MNKFKYWGRLNSGIWLFGRVLQVRLDTTASSMVQMMVMSHVGLGANSLQGTTIVNESLINGCLSL